MSAFTVNRSLDVWEIGKICILMLVAAKRRYSIAGMIPRVLSKCYGTEWVLCVLLLHRELLSFVQNIMIFRLVMASFLN